MTVIQVAIPVLRVKKHRSETPGYVRLNSLILFVNLADNRGPDQRRSGPHPERISSCYIKALRSSQLGSGFGAYSQFYARYYNETRTHLALDKDARFSPSSANRCGQVTCHPGRTSSPLRPRLSCRYTHTNKESQPCGLAASSISSAAAPRKPLAPRSRQHRPPRVLRAASLDEDRLAGPGQARRTPATELDRGTVWVREP